MNAQPYWKQKPREPWSDWRMYGMLLPVLVSAFGFFVTGVFAFAFSDISVIPGPAQSWMVIVGSALIIFGAELNTPFTTIEVFRKILRKEANAWDISALVVSLVGTVVNLLVTFASRLSLNPIWKSVLLNWGPLLSGFAVACDYYGALVELGFLFGSYELRMDTWQEEEVAWNEKTGYAEPVELKPAKMADLRSVVAKMNGDWADKAAPTVQQLAEALAVRGKEFSSESTGTRWARDVRQGKVN